MALNDAAILESSQPFLDAAIGPHGYFILAGFHALHIHADITLHIAVHSKTVFGAPTSHVDRVGTGIHRLGRRTSRIHTGAAKLAAFNDGDGHTGGRKPRRQGRAGLARPDDDGVVVFHCGSASPLCSRTMYSAYQSGQLASRWPVRFSCCPWAASARRRALAKSLTELYELTPASTRPGSRVVTSCISHW